MDYNLANNLTPEEKVLIVRARTLVGETRTRDKEMGLRVSMPYKIMLKKQCQEIEKLIDKLKPGKNNKKLTDKLDYLIRCLQTTSENILEWKFKM